MLPDFHNKNFFWQNKNERKMKWKYSPGWNPARGEKLYGTDWIVAVTILISSSFKEETPSFENTRSRKRNVSKVRWGKDATENRINPGIYHSQPDATSFLLLLPPSTTSFFRQRTYLDEAEGVEWEDDDDDDDDTSSTLKQSNYWVALLVNTIVYCCVSLAAIWIFYPAVM